MTNSYQLMYLVEDLLKKAENRYQLIVGISRQTRQNLESPTEHIYEPAANPIIKTILNQNQDSTEYE